MKVEIAGRTNDIKDMREYKDAMELSDQNAQKIGIIENATRRKAVKNARAKTRAVRAA